SSDLDGYLNRGDNCQLIANGENENDTPIGNQTDKDNDQIGDPCDPDPKTPNGHLLTSVLAQDLKLGTRLNSQGQSAPVLPPYCSKLGVKCYGQESSSSSGSSSTGIIVGAAVVAAIVVLGGGAFVVMRRRTA